MTVDLDELRRYDEAIAATAAAYGLDCFEQEFEVCDHEEMIGYMAYAGMPSHYHHWSYGKAHERLKTLYDHGVQGLPYEMVINSDPALAYLMGDNSLCLNVLTIAHVYGHNDFFKNNFTFRGTRPEHTLASFKSHAERVRDYIEDPSIGIDRVERVLDAAHALALQCKRNLAIRRDTRDEQARRLFDAALPRKDPYQDIHPTSDYVEPDLRRIPLEPDEDLLLFIRDHNPYLLQWEKDLLTIVHEETRYFIPQIETKIMNEGWASYWHYQIMTHLDLPAEMSLEFMVHHNQVLRPAPGGLNPYHLGFAVWSRIYRAHEGDGPADHSQRSAGRDALFAAREIDRDISFLRRFLDEPLMRKLGMFEYTPRKNEYVVSEICDEEGWERTKDTLLRNVGMAGIPVIKVEDADFAGSRTLLLRHYHDGRDLELANAERTLEHAFRLWGRPVLLETILDGKALTLSYDDAGFGSKAVG
jgi:stage V sporulation protein R